ncbi:bifunctional adenosylcobinamide kinase/adenosylcobinamide-phosphate guanylyltransferase [Cellvibrio zantedeschiae]|uniref:Bifunctional adenosylcobalamin biosynthesis protein n=1 Tax=Cellvibrio zantedeschiae TaxID=1237077 RepID=A0ABQ3B1U5_9GAMM|nr:bifunctional adenosylcobinamide kinase/adenosylcobinamide-phosphate guanylyltransferase [Cellvibrio zantedeschiae]GGY74563.1 bifunctional adenosylcobinamide kinase/adenosylcobinamide-phosphate guanylyltransferase [Cellvibrio zantedeschiae]
MSITLVIGGARSGKSKYAEQLAINSQLPVTYVATATALDAEMEARIIHHQTRRPVDWALHECPLDLANLLENEAQKEHTILVDCLTLWLNNQLYKDSTQNFSLLFSELVEAIKDSPAKIILVSNEVGLGIIPLGEVTRQFVDEAGRLNQFLAQVADQVIFTVAGLPLVLKQA